MALEFAPFVLGLKLWTAFSSCSNMGGRIKQATIAGTLCIVFLVLMFAGFPYRCFGAHPGFRVFMVKIDPQLGKGYLLEPVKDFFINGGGDDGLRVSMVLDVYRKKTVRNKYEAKDFEISILVGQVRVIRLFNNVAITRILALTSSDDTPVLRYRTVMIGDYAVPSRDQVDTERDKKISDVNKMIPETDYEPRSSGSGVLLPSKVLFEFDDWKLKPEAMGVLSTVYDMFNQSEDKDILIEGHTCSLGTDKYNLELSRKRAQSVADYLMHTIGVSGNHIHIKYYGEEFPVASNHTEEGRVKNRRVDIRFLQRGTKAPLLRHNKSLLERQEIKNKALP